MTRSTLFWPPRLFRLQDIPFLRTTVHHIYVKVRGIGMRGPRPSDRHVADCCINSAGLFRAVCLLCPPAPPAKEVLGPLACPKPTTSVETAAVGCVARPLQRAASATDGALILLQPTALTPPVSTPWGRAAAPWYP